LSILHIVFEDNLLFEKILLELMGEPRMSGHQILAQAESEQFNNKKCKFLWSHGVLNCLQSSYTVLLFCRRSS
jgi:hypothetical protein